MQPQRLAELEEKWLNGTITPDERIEYATWYNAVNDEPLEIEGDEQGLEQRMMEGIYAKAGLIKTVAPVHRVHFLRRYRWTAAAAVFILVCSTVLFFYTKNTNEAPVSASLTKDITAPSSNRATLTTGDGKIIPLENLKQSDVADASFAKDNTLQFDGNTVKAEMRTVTNPRRSTAIHMELPDGTLVWLNAASSISFPSVFTGNERLVTLTGEGYFEAKHDVSKPFRVKVGNETIEDLGTKFNIKAYADEAGVRITLIEGAVKVRDRVLKPGQQAITTDKLVIRDDVETDDVLAWKEEKFKYHSVDLKTALKEAARWYDVQVDFEGEVSGTISGGTPRGVNLSEFLNMLEYSGKVKFEITDKKIIVKPLKN